jgi:hypothetical protein
MSDEILVQLRPDPPIVVELAQPTIVNMLTSTATNAGALIAQAGHGLAVGQVIFVESGIFSKAINTAPETLAYYLIAEILSIDVFRLATPMSVVDGYTGLTPSGWYHCSPDVAGDLSLVSGGDTKPVGAYAANPMGQALSATQLIYSPSTPYQV